MWCRRGAAKLHLPPSSFRFNFLTAKKQVLMFLLVPFSAHKNSKMAITLSAVQALS